MEMYITPGYSYHQSSSPSGHSYIQFSKALQFDMTNFNPIRSGGVAFKAPAPLSFFALTHLILELHYCAFGTFPKKNSLTPCGENKFLIGGHDLAVREVSKYKVDMIFIFFREFNTMLEIVDS